METPDLARENALLKARLAEVEATLAETQEANRRLEDILRAAQREKFGKSSEKLSPDQFNLPLEDAEFAQGVLEAAQEKAEAAMQRARGEEPRKPKRNRGHLPSHLPRVERVIDPASTLCPCGCGEMSRIGVTAQDAFCFALPRQVPVSSPVAQCVQCSRRSAFRTLLQSPWVRRTRTTWFAQLSMVYQNLKQSMKLLNYANLK